MSDDPPTLSTSVLEDRSVLRGFVPAPVESWSRLPPTSGLFSSERSDSSLRNQLFNESHAAKIWKVAQVFLRPHVSSTCFVRSAHRSLVLGVSIIA